MAPSIWNLLEAIQAPTAQSLLGVKEILGPDTHFEKNDNVRSWP